MRNNPIKSILKKTWFRDGSRHRILFGPMKGLYFRTNALTRISPIYSGPERDHQNLFARLLREGDHVLDIGANWGNHTLYFAHLVGSIGVVHAFEPLPEAMEELRWHVRENGFSNVHPHEMALSDENGEATFVRGSFSETSHLTAVHRERQQAGSESFTVKVATLDQFVSREMIERIDLVKVDVEGAESKVLEGAEKTIRKFKPQLIVDLHTPEQDLKVAALLDSWGYDIARVGGGPITRIDRSYPDPEGVWGSIHGKPRS